MNFQYYWTVGNYCYNILRVYFSLRAKKKKINLAKLKKIEFKINKNYIIQQLCSVTQRSMIITPQELKACARDQLSRHVGLPWDIPRQNLQTLNRMSKGTAPHTIINDIVIYDNSQKIPKIKQNQVHRNFYSDRTIT